MEKKRLYYVDWLRILVILSLIPFHAALTYIKFGTVYIKFPVSGMAAIPFTIIPALLSDFFMTLLFFLSGIASFYSFKSRKSNLYIKERVKKLLLPLILGTALLCPVQAYMKGIYEGFHGSFVQFVPQFFSPKIVYYLGYAHLWFLLYLFVFSLICVPLFKRWQNKIYIEKISAFITKGNRIFIPIIFIIAAEFILRPFFTGKQTLIMDWANDVVYLSMFIFGYLYAADSAIQNRVKKLFNLSKAVGLLALVPILFANYMWEVNNSKAVYLTVLWALAKGFYECSAIVFLLCIASRHLNKESKQVKYLSKASFPIYIFHFLPLTFFTLIFINAKFSIYLKYILTVILSYIAVFLIYEAIRNLKLLRRKVF